MVSTRSAGKTHCGNVAELVPSNGEEFEWIDEDAHAWNVPKREYYDGVYSDLRERW